MTLYVRVGNTTMTSAEAASLSARQVEQLKIDAEKANQKRLENIQRSMGIKAPEAITLDVTPAGVAKRAAAIKAEEERIAAETAAIDKDLGKETTAFVAEAEPPVETKKPKGSKKTAPSA